MTQDNLKTVYEQYWLHARHVESEIWLFTGAFAVAITAIIALLGVTNLELSAKAGAILLGVVFSILGYFALYALRVPFLRFVLMAELIAIKEFGIKDQYRRFFPKQGKCYPEDKWLDLHDVLAIFYSAMAGLMVYLFVGLYCCLWWTVASGIIVFAALVALHYCYIRPTKYIKEICKQLANELTSPPQEIAKDKL